MAAAIKVKKEFLIIRSEHYLYAVAPDMAAAEGYRKYFELSDFEIHGPIVAKNIVEVIEYCVTHLGLRLDNRMRRVYASLKEPSRPAYKKKGR